MASRPHPAPGLSHTMAVTSLPSGSVPLWLVHQTIPTGSGSMTNWDCTCPCFQDEFEKAKSSADVQRPQREGATDPTSLVHHEGQLTQPPS